MTELTLLRRGSALSELARQRQILDTDNSQAGFTQALGDCGHFPLHARGLEVLQINVGKVCNQACRHCHVDAGPDRRESMSAEIASACLKLLREMSIPTLDITGGAPEMNPQFRRMIVEAYEMQRRVIDRCNLTILVAPGYEDLPEFLAAHRVEVVASLPCYLEENVDRQRGHHVFQRSLMALQRLNQLGYGQAESPLTLTLVYNPVGPSLPPDQTKLEEDYRRELRARYGIEFTRLYTITNMPISRFLADLLENGQFEPYLQKLVEAFNLHFLTNPQSSPD